MSAGGPIVGSYPPFDTSTILKRDQGLGDGGGGAGGGAANPYPGLDYAKDTKQPTLVNGKVPVDGPVTDTQLRASAVSVTGPATDAQLRASALPVTGPLTDTQLRAAAVSVSGPATDAQMRATALPVSGPLTDTQLRANPVPVIQAGAQRITKAEGGASTSATVSTATQVVAADSTRVKFEFQNLGTAAIILRINQGADTTVAVAGSTTKRMITVPAGQLYVTETDGLCTGLISVLSATASVPYSYLAS